MSHGDSAGPGPAGADEAMLLAGPSPETGQPYTEEEWELRERLRLEAVERRSRSLRSSPVAQTYRQLDRATGGGISAGAGQGQKTGPASPAEVMRAEEEAALKQALGTIAAAATGLEDEVAAEAEADQAFIEALRGTPAAAGPIVPTALAGTAPERDYSSPARLEGSEDPPGWERIHEGSFLEAAYEAMEAQANPLDPTTKYFLNRFIYDFYSRRRATVEEHWSRSLRFLSTELANASFRAESRDIALLAAGAATEELQVDRVVLRIQANPREPHSATADFDRVRMEMANEVSRERWSLSLQFQFLEEIPPDLIVHNPMGIVITYLQGDRAIVTGVTGEP